MARKAKSSKMPSIANPRQVILVTCREEIEIMGRKQHKDNVITVCWHTPLSKEPNMYGIALGKDSFSRKLIEKSGVFVINFIGRDLAEAAGKAGTTHGEHIDKITACGLITEECTSVDAPLLAEAHGWLECEIFDKVETGDHVFFIGKVIHGHHAHEGRRLFQISGTHFTTTEE